MGLFTQDKKLKFKKIPSTTEQNSARSYQVGLMNTDLQFPTQQVADLTPEEQAIQNALPDYFAQSNANYGASSDYYNSVLNGGYDPLTSPYYQGMRTNLEARNKANVQGVERSQQASGMLKSGPTAALAAEQNRMGNADIATVEGQLLDAERNRMQNAAGALPALDASRINNAGMLSNIAAQKRAIQDAKNVAAYNTAIQDMLAPYQYNATIAQALLNETRYAGYETGGGMNDLGQSLTMGSVLAGSFFNPAGGAAAMSGGGSSGYGSYSNSSGGYNAFDSSSGSVAGQSQLADVRGVNG